MAAGITFERTRTGLPVYARIDLRKHGESKNLQNFFEEKNIEIEEPIKWTAKMKRSMAQAKRGEFTVVDSDNFWDV